MSESLKIRRLRRPDVEVTKAAHASFFFLTVKGIGRAQSPACVSGPKVLFVRWWSGLISAELGWTSITRRTKEKWTSLKRLCVEYIGSYIAFEGTCDWLLFIQDFGSGGNVNYALINSARDFSFHFETKLLATAFHISLRRSCFQLTKTFASGLE